MSVLFFSSIIPLYIEKNLVGNYVRFWEWNWKCTPLSAQSSFSRKSNLKFCIIFNMISFADTYGSVKIRLAYSKVLLLINYFDRRLWNTFKNRVFVFPGPRPRPSPPAPTCIWRPRPSVCINRPLPSIFVCLIFVLQLKFVIISLVSSAYFRYFYSCSVYLYQFRV